MNLLFLKLRVLIKIISAIFRIYRRVNLYQRFPNYIGATQFISAISQLYRRNSIYISDFPIISAQLNLYQRFPNYISVCLNISTYQQNPTIKRSRSNKYDGATSYFMLLYSFSALFFYDMPFFIPLYCTVICVMIKVNHAPFSAPYSTHFCLFSIDVIG